MVSSGELLRVVGCEKTNILGKELEMYCLEPFYKTNSTQTLLFKIPVENVKNGAVRDPLSVDEFKKIIKSELHNGTIEIPATKKDAQNLLCSQGITIALGIMKSIWRENQNAEYITKSKKDIFELSVKQLVEEFAYSNKVSLAKGEQLFMKIVRRELKGKPPVVGVFA